MRKNLISLLAAGALGCGSALPQVLENPAKIRANEHEFVKHSYENHETNCTRQVYIGLNPELKLRSVVGVEHCIKVGTTEGRYFWQRYEDKYGDDNYDSCYADWGNSYVERSVDDSAIPCGTKENREIFDIVYDAL